MTKREAAIVSAYTGVMLGKFPDMHEYIEEIMGCLMGIYELFVADKEMVKQISEKSKQDFCNISVSD